MSNTRHFLNRRLAVSVAVGITLGAGGAAWAASNGDKACTGQAKLLAGACKAEVRDDYLVAQAVCLNVADDEARAECEAEADEARSEDGQLCKEQQSARVDLCDLIGDGRYDPNFDPALFDDPKAPTNPNPYYPLQVGNRWVFEEEDETVTVTVLDETKRIEGVDCITVHDIVEIDGATHEDTDDWYGVRKNGDVDYCGEISKNFESFEGDDPAVPELVEVEGSWKTGRDGDLPGTQFFAAPEVGRVYRQEYAPGNAEDAAEVLSTTYRYGDDPALDEFVPQALAELMCSDGDCVVTGEFTPVEPDVFERKYYARGIGLFLEVNPEDGSAVPLVECNVDPKCDEL
jgi:hypothetical protein